ncbi:MAG: hypothetical protein MR006_04830 [Arcanobacterium sp.]|nr:hypothetical protein [Arcanobacterium sp.]MDY5588688.1 hypothetical protein [Arcanobacterium sp.]
MATAPRADQLALLTVAQLDSDIARLRQSDVRHPLRVSAGELMNLVAAKSQEIADNERAEANAREALSALSERTDALTELLREKKALFRAGTGMDSRGLLTLQSEIDGQQAKLDELSEAEFEALEAVENCEARSAQLREELAELNRKLLAEQVQLENAVTDIHSDITKLTEERERRYAPLSDSLKREYERAATSGGYTVIGVHPNGRSTGGIELSPIELNRIKNADPEQVWISDEYECIVVLLDA